MNDIETNEDGIIREFVHIGAQLRDGEDRTKGQVGVLSRDHPAEVPESSQMFLPCFIAMNEDMETLELPGNPATAVGRCHRELTTPGRTATSRLCPEGSMLREQDGTLTILGMFFSWLKHGVTVDRQHKAGVLPLIDVELNMCRQHQHPINGNSNRSSLLTARPNIWPVLGVGHDFLVESLRISLT